ncbi:hypothetical protein GW17_00024259 [Ensete ventricosum]|nr:hypothetical protein GW17_00024259 [Ensete ventricosum]RZR98436.1 hypothetical protein BHM03_00027794 [Ensete ventricosum]
MTAAQVKAGPAALPLPRGDRLRPGSAASPCATLTKEPPPGGDSECRRQWSLRRYEGGDGVCNHSMLIRSTLCVEFGPENSMGLRPPLSSLVTIAAAAADVAVPSEQKVYDVILKQSSLVKKKSALTTALDVKPDFAIPGSLSLLKEASDRCGEDCAEYAKTFYLG